MTKAGARAAANVLLGAAGAAAAYVVFRNPSLRHRAFRAARWWLGATVPAYLLQEVRRAWVESAHSA